MVEEISCVSVNAMEQTITYTNNVATGHAAQHKSTRQEGRPGECDTLPPVGVRLSLSFLLWRPARGDDDGESRSFS